LGADLIYKYYFSYRKKLFLNIYNFINNICILNNYTNLIEIIRNYICLYIDICYQYNRIVSICILFDNITGNQQWYPIVGFNYYYNFFYSFFYNFLSNLFFFKNFKQKYNKLL
jgi:hypothetical protein